MRVVFPFVLFLLSFGAARGQQVHLQDAYRSWSVTYPAYLEDRSGSLSFQQALAATRHFTPATIPVPNFLGNLSKAIWYRFDATNTSTDTAWFLEIKGGYMHQQTLYQLFDDGRVDSLALYGDQDFTARPVRSSNLVFPVHLQRGERVSCYLRATSKSLIRPYGICTPGCRAIAHLYCR
ncbi:7TM-DISM domain-containing protein [Paraflavitalea pollutisoli]|uniref:7TMR-DISMED2 domain-containing protein n=1 Tax=Paraflavitalea pollutisoli TaxID=3034143 RepID=UPI0023EDA81D|nr:7TM-DISM domain-containing protein [Paraflavitalea sp. H1-2-19X]